MKTPFFEGSKNGVFYERVGNCFRIYPNTSSAQLSAAETVGKPKVLVNKIIV